MTTLLFMLNRSDKICAEINEIINDYIKFIKPYDGMPITHKDFPKYTLYNHYTIISDAILRYAPNGSQYQKNVKKFNDTIDIREISEVNKAVGGCLNILNALKTAYAKNFLNSIESTINNEIFDDFLEMAEHFLESGDQYKCPAAFLIGGVLEEHLRKLAIKNDIPIKNDDEKYRKAEALNVDLKKSGVYDLNAQKTVTSLLDIRNNADHAHWDKIKKENVDLMLQHVKLLIKQYPA